MPIAKYETFSEFFIPILFGTNSPKIRVKNDKIIVITIIEIPFQTSTVKNGIQLWKVGAKTSANVSDANALDKNPANVIPIWIVAKNLLGDFNIFSICFAFLSPSFALFSIFASFSDINAISLAAKKAFIKISIINMKTCPNIF